MMSCNRDSGCLNIARGIYPGLKGEINSSIGNVCNQVDEIVGELNSLAIPEDYLGSKIKTKLSEICSGFESDKAELNSAKANVNAFIDNKIKEHYGHYYEWQRNQELAKKEQEEQEK